MTGRKPRPASLREAVGRAFWKAATTWTVFVVVYFVSLSVRPLLGLPVFNA